MTGRPNPDAHERSHRVNRQDRTPSVPTEMVSGIAAILRTGLARAGEAPKVG